MRQTKDSEYCLRISIRRCFESIVMGTEAEVADGWLMLKELQDDKEFSNLIDCEDVLRDILNGDILNFSEVPKIMAWISPYIEEKPNSDVDPISNDIVILLQKTDIRDMTHLVMLLKTLLDHRVYLPPSADHTKLCEAVIVSLSSFQMPLEPKEILQFYDNTSKIQNFLKVVCLNTKNIENNTFFICLQTLYNIIANIEKKYEPGPGLAAILHLVDPSVIAQAVDWILSQPQSIYHLVQALTVLCNWIPKWRSEWLSIWIMEFMRGLERQEKCYILIKVMESSINILDLMHRVLLVPVIRQNSSCIIYHVLKKLNSQTIIHNIIKAIPMLINTLIKEDSESSKECVQNLVDIVKVLSLRFPAYRVPDNVENNFPVLPRVHLVEEIYSELVWQDEMKIFEPVIVPQRQLSDKVGLSNLGNTCYMNSVLQALLMTKQFCYEVLNYPAYETNKTPLIRKLQNLFALLLYSTRTSLSPTEILQASRPMYFLPGQQQDSSEFLCHLLDVLHEQEKSVTSITNCSGCDSSSSSLKSKTEVQENEITLSTENTITHWITEEDLTDDSELQQNTQLLTDFSQGEDLGQLGFVEQLSDYHSDSTDSGIQSVDGEEAGTYTSLVHKILGGECKITYQCAQCGTSSHNTDKFRDLQLCFPEEIRENQEVSVQDLINCYLKPEKLTGENKYRCDKCMKLCDAQRIITILQAPAHLILSLKHFRYDFDSRLRTKLRHKVLYNDTIQLPVSDVSNATAEKYHLYAAVVHSGYSMDYGHYLTYACDSKHNWYRFNDSFVSRTTLEEFNRLKPPDTPYILFYEKSGVVNGFNEDKPDLSTLSEHLQEFIANDTLVHIEELRQRTILSRSNRYSKTITKQNDNSDDENPPSSCRSAIDIPANRFLY